MDRRSVRSKILLGAVFGLQAAYCFCCGTVEAQSHDCCGQPENKKSEKECCPSCIWEEDNHLIITTKFTAEDKPANSKSHNDLELVSNFKKS